MDTILKKTEIKGRPFNGIKLSKELIIKAGLQPKYLINTQNKKIYVSDPYYVEKRKDLAFLAYVENDNKYILRTFFYSRSQGSLRSLTAYKYNIIDGLEVPTWNDKGYGEESISLPLPMQYELSKLSAKKYIKVDNSYLIFYGIAEESHENLHFYSEVKKEPIKLSGKFYSNDNNLKIKPEICDFNNTVEMPDYSYILYSWKLKTNLYGNVTYKVFKSKNNKYLYLFCTDELRRTWIGSIDSNSVITSYGVRNKWVSGGCLTTPAYEYLTETKDQTGGYGNLKLRSGHYVDMYKNYLSKIPLLKKY